MVLLLLMHYAEYVYSFKGNAIKLKGVKMNTGVVVGPNWTTTFEYRGRLCFSRESGDADAKRYIIPLVKTNSLIRIV